MTRGSENSMKRAIALPALICLAVSTLFANAGFAQEAATEAEVKFAHVWIAGVSPASTDEDVLAAVMLAQQHEPSSVEQLLATKRESPAYEKLRLSLAWYHCRNDMASAFCAGNGFADELIALDPENVEPYLYAMMTALDAGREDAALAALATASNALDADTYYLEKLTLLRNRLKDSSYPEGRINAAAEGLAGALDTYFLYARLLAICAEKSRESRQWNAQCFALGNKLVNSGNTVVQNIHGYGIVRDTLPADSAARTEVLDRMARYNKVRDDANVRLEWILDVSRKPDLVYTEIKQFGEFQAVERALKRAEE
jgi:hypothetical protein